MTKLDVRKVAGSSPTSSTNQEKSELIPHRERVRILYFTVGCHMRILWESDGLADFLDITFLWYYNIPSF